MTATAARPGRQQAVGRALAALTAGAGRVLRGEPAAAVAGWFALAVVMTWPTLAHPASRVPRDIYDPLGEAWRVAQSGHGLFHDPDNLWDGNVFYPEQGTLAYSDSLLGYAPITLFGSGPTATLVWYNLLYVFAFGLAGLGAYVLARALGSGVAGALVAGAAFAYAPWRWEHGGHLNILSTGGMALALGLLAYGHGWSLRRDRPPLVRRPGWAFTGWAVAAWQMTLGFGVTIPFAYLLGAISLVTTVRWPAGRAVRPTRTLVMADIAGVTVFVVTSLLMVLPYLQVLSRYPSAQRSTAEIDFYSPPLLGFFIGPDSSAVYAGHQEEWRAQLSWAPEQVLLPGAILILLAVVGVSVSAWSRWRRLAVLVATLTSVVYALGSNAPADGRWTYLFLVDHAPGWDALRTPGRLVIWTTLGLGLLAAGAVTEISTTLRDRLAADREPSASATPATTPATTAVLALALIPALLVTLEGRGAQEFPAVPRPPVPLSTLEAPIMVLPTDFLSDCAATWWSTDGFPRITNGSSSFTPPTAVELREAAATFPDAASVQMLHDAGVRTVLLDTARAAGSTWAGTATAQVDGLPLTRREVPGGVVFTLDP